MATLTREPALRRPAPLPLRSAVGLAGPAFVASVAYIDPGNFATNFTAGAQYGYALIWVVVAANVMAILVQYLSSKVGIVTGMSLPELCRERFGPRLNRALWVQAEVVVMATDVAEFVGCAFGLHLLLGIPLFWAGVATAVAVSVVLPLRRLGSRPFERVIVLMLIAVAVCIGYLLVAGGPQDASAMLQGLSPSFEDGTIGLAVGIVGATVMPHAVYLHSGLQRDRLRESRAVGTPPPTAAILRASRWDCVVGLGAAGMVNLMMLGFAAAAFAGVATASGDAFELDTMPAALDALLGGGAVMAFGVALVFSGFSSATVGTYAGEMVMEGFIGRRIPLAVRRGVTMVPSLLVLGLPVSIGQALVFSQVILSFGIPFALVTLLVVTRDAKIMGAAANRWTTTAAMAVVTALISLLNGYLVVETVLQLRS